LTGPDRAESSHRELVQDYICLTLMARTGEAEAQFKARLAAFWTHLLRSRPEEYEKVYAEATRFGLEDGRVLRQYMVEAGAVDAISVELAASGIDHAPIDPDDVYSKYEASSSDWFQIEH
jgi:hypothetical protein